MRQIFSLEWFVIFIWAFGQENYINAQGCGGRYTGSSGSFTSPNYPHNYNNSLSCTYTIDPGSTTVTLIFQYFETEIKYDFVKVYDSLNTSMEYLSGNYAWHILQPASFYRVHFTTDSSVTSSGFKAVWTDAANALGILGGNAVLSWDLHQTGIKEFTVRNIQLGTLVYHVTNYNQVDVVDRNFKSRVSFTGNITSSGTGVFKFTLYDVNFEDEGQYVCFKGSQTAKGPRIIDCGQRLHVFETDVVAREGENATLSWRLSQPGTVEFTVMKTGSRQHVLHVTDYNQVTVSDAYKSRAKYTGNVTATGSGVFAFVEYNVVSSGYYRCFTGSPDSNGTQMSECGQRLIILRHLQDPYIFAPHTVTYGRSINLTCYTDAYTSSFSNVAILTTHIMWKKNGILLNNRGRYRISRMDWIYLNNTLTIRDVRREDDEDIYTCQAMVGRTVSNWSDGFVFGQNYSPVELGNQTNVYEGGDATLTWELPHNSNNIFIRNHGTFDNLLHTVFSKVFVTETYWQRIKVNLYISSPENDYLSITLVNVTSADAGIISCQKHVYIPISVPGCRNLLTVYRFQRSYITVEAIARHRLKCYTYFQQWPRNPNLTPSVNWRRNGEQVVIGGRYEVTPPIRDNESFWSSQLTISTIGTEDRNDSYSCHLEDENGLATPWSVDFEFLTYGLSLQFPSYTVAYGAGEVLLQWLQPRLEKNIFLQKSHTGETILTFDFERVKIASPYISRYLFGGMVTQSTSNVVFLVLQNVTAADAGNINCYVYDSSTQLQIPQCGTLLVVSEQPSKPTVSSYGPAVAGHPVTLTCNSTSRSLPVGHPLSMNYTWRGNGFQLESGGRHQISGSSLTITNILADDNVGYSCQAVEEDVMSQWSDDYVFNILATADANLLMFAVVGACSTFVVIAVIGTVVFCQAYKKLKRTLDERSVTHPCVEMQPADGSRVNMYDAFETPRAEPNEYKFEDNEAFYENI
ncbi:uncharacterized protein LOC124115256 [Haliotis rufescens]|uniref:uncharacterized protein LOC124115256 n=1 Tax=Haliotis rufescens TaxID=6454 RepID=UPI00201F45D3|nr:uncharacterized protein LOC124115256 [Haliotis rufescens]